MMSDTRNNMLLLPSAIQLAVKYHAQTHAKDNTLYVFHPLRMMAEAETYTQKIVAILHDTLEDTDLRMSDLQRAGFSTEVCEALDAITKREGEPYEDFIERIALNPLATYVKILDLRDNIDVTRLPSLGEWELQRTVKYHKALLRLLQVQRNAR